jgi:hypothetical protein
VVGSAGVRRVFRLGGWRSKAMRRGLLSQYCCMASHLVPSSAQIRTIIEIAPESFPHDPTPKTVNHIFRLQGIPRVIPEPDASGP